MRESVNVGDVGEVASKENMDSSGTAVMDVFGLHVTELDTESRAALDLRDMLEKAVKMDGSFRLLLVLGITCPGCVLVSLVSDLRRNSGP